MKVLFVSTNREKLPDPVFPLGLSYVASATHDAGHEVATVDLCFAENIEETLNKAIEESQPDVIGLSLRNVDDAAYPQITSYIELYQEVVASCRKNSRATLVVGGSAFTIMPEEFLSVLDVDYGIVGEGEKTFVDFLAYLEGGKVGPLPQAVVDRNHTEASPCRLENWSQYKPARQFFSAHDYYDKGGMLNLQTRRGCPFKCVYCSYPRIEGSRMRLRPVGEAVDELEKLAEQTAVEHFFIVDSVFNHPKEYAIAFCDEVIARGLGEKLRWSCYANAGRMDAELIERMQKAGCEGVEFGTDGLVDEVLESLGKGFTYAEVEETSRLCRELGLRFCHFLFIGSPDETPDHTKLAVERLAELQADSSLIMTGIRVFPGTKLAERACEELGIEHIGLDPVFYISPKLVGQIEPLVEEIIAAHSSWVLPGFRRNFNERIQQVLRRAGKRGVLWDFLSPR